MDAHSMADPFLGAGGEASVHRRLCSVGRSRCGESWLRTMGVVSIGVTILGVALLSLGSQTPPAYTAEEKLVSFPTSSYIASAENGATTQPGNEVEVQARSGLLETKSASTSSADPCAAAGGLPPPEGAVPWLRIVGSNASQLIDAMHWPGMREFDPPAWQGKATLCLPGLAIAGAKVHTRGHISVRFPKHQFALKLSHEVGILGMHPSKHWILAAPWSDTSFQRNPFAFEVYRRLGGWATELRFVNVLFGDTDFGLFYIGEKIARTPHGLFFPSAGPKNPAQDGFLLSVDWPKNASQVMSTVTNTSFRIRYPSEGHMSSDKVAYLQQFLDDVDLRAAKGVAGRKPIADGGSLEDIVDYSSFVRYYILEELAKDVDGYAASNFVIAQGGKLFSAAPWDFDNAFGYACAAHVYYKNIFSGVEDAGVSGWQVENARDRHDICTLFYGAVYDKCIRQMPMQKRIIDLHSNKRQLFLNIWRHRSFRDAFAAGWRAARRPGGPLTDEAIRKLVEGRAAELAVSANRDMRVWGAAVRCVTLCCHAEDTNDFDGSTRHLLEYLLGRAHWIDDHINDL